MTAYRGNQKEGTIYKGSTKIARAYKGNQLVYQNELSVPIYGAYAKGSLTVTWWMIGGMTVNDYIYSVDGSSFPTLGLKAVISSMSGVLGQSNSTITVGTRTYTYNTVRTYNNVKIYRYTNTTYNTTRQANDFYWMYVQEKSQVGDKCLVDWYGATDFLNQGIEYFMRPESADDTTLVIRNSRNRTTTKTRSPIKNYWWSRSRVVEMS